MKHATANGSLLPRSPDGHAPGAMMSLLAHALLIAALAYGVNWRSPTPQTISAELWAAVPQQAAPPAAQAEPVRPVQPAQPKPEPAPQPAPEPKPVPVEKVAPPEPTPAPPDPQIAIEKARKEKQRERAEKLLAEEAEKAEKARAAKEEQARQAKLEREKAQREKAEQEKLRLAQEREKAAEAERQAKQREANIRRMMGQAAATAGTSGTAAATAAPSANYAGRLIGAIKPNIVFTEDFSGNPAAVVEVRCAPSGTILGRTLVKSSGLKEWDEAVLRAIDRTATLPRDTDGRVPGTLNITFRPRD
jgi:colicin import membrane protein